MSKAVLVVEMPQKCRECDLYVCYRQYAGDSGDCFCGKTKDDVNPESKPNWCPLRELPEKRSTEYNPARNPYITEGYNACIDELLKTE